MSASFSEYQRQEVYCRLKYLLIVLYGFTVLIGGAYFVEKEEFGIDDDTLRFFSFQIGPVTLSMTLSYLATWKNIRLVELQGINMFGTHMIIVLLSNYSGLFEMNEFYHYSQFDLALIYWLFYNGLLTTQFKWHCLGRLFLILPAFITLMAVVSQSDLSMTLTFGVFSFVIASICELIFYVQMKAQVKLFIASQVIKVQER